MSVEQGLGPAPAATPPRRARWLLLLVLLVVFVSGGIVGGGSTDYMHRSGWVRLMRRPGEVPDRVMQMLRGKLDLSDEQATQVDKIVRDRHREIEKLRAEVQPRIDRQIDEMQSEIDALLNNEQRDRWHDWVESLRHRWGPDHHSRHHDSHWSGHGPRPPHSASPQGKDCRKDGADRESAASGSAARDSDSRVWSGRGCPGECKSRAAHAAVSQPAADIQAGEPATKSPADEVPAAETQPAAPARAEPAAAGPAPVAPTVPVDPSAPATAAAVSPPPVSEAAPPAKTDP